MHAAHKDDDDDDDGAEINSQTGVGPGTKAVRARGEEESEREGDAVVGGRQVGTVTQTIDLETGHCHAVYNREKEVGEVRRGEKRLQQTKTHMEKGFA